MTKIEIDQLTVRYGAVSVLEALSLEIPAGCFFSLLGPSGCGKTTLLRSIAGFARPSSGTLRFDGSDVTHLPAHQRGIGMVFQDYALFPDKTVFNNVAYGLRARRMSSADIRLKVHQYLERVGMEPFAQRYPADLSGGQRQRVALARALVVEPRVLLMDEPLSNLDARLRTQIRESLADLQREIGVTTVLVTHDQEEALAMSDRIALLHKGRVEQVGTPRDLYERPATAHVADFFGAANLLEADILGAGTAADRLRVRTLDCEMEVCASGRTVSMGKAYIAARPEDLRISDSAGVIANALPGTIQRRRYLGCKISYHIELAQGQIVCVDTRARDPSYDPQQRVCVLFDPATTVVVSP